MKKFYRSSRAREEYGLPMVDNDRRSLIYDFSLRIIKFRVNICGLYFSISFYKSFSSSINLFKDIIGCLTSSSNKTPGFWKFSCSSPITC